jgi:hypothetical protein
MESFWDYLQNLTDAQSIISRGGFYFLLVVVFAETGLFFGFFYQETICYLWQACCVLQARLM